MVHENEIIAIESNLRKFTALISRSMTGLNGYYWFFKKFKVEERFMLTVDGKEYYFQKLRPEVA